MDLKTFLKKYPYKLWEVKSPDDYSWEHVTFEGNGYVLVGDIRYDFDERFFKEERVLWNQLRKEQSVRFGNSININ